MNLQWRTFCLSAASAASAAAAAATPALGQTVVPAVERG